MMAVTEIMYPLLFYISAEFAFKLGYDTEYYDDHILLIMNQKNS